MTLTFTGDISITGAFVEKVKTNSEIFSREVLSHLQNNDFIIGNLEGPTTLHLNETNHNTPLKSHPNTIKYLKKRNIKLFNLANNHILDYGEIGLKDTLKEITTENCQYFGAGITQENSITPVIIKKEGISVAVFGITKTSPSKMGNTEVFSSDDFSILKKQVNTYKKQVDFVIINFHGGEEYTLFPSPVKRRFFKKIAGLKNVDCVVAHHSHTFQGYETFDNTPVFYSLGNFIFDIPNHKIHKNTNTSALLKIHFTKDSFTFNFIPYEIINGEVIAYNLISFKEKLQQICDFDNYRTKWQKEAYKVLFRKENILIKNDTPNSLQEQSFINLFFSKNFYTKIFNIVKDKYLFSLYINAVYYKIKMKLK